MRATSVCSVPLAACLLASTVGMAADSQEKLLAKAAQLFGEPLNAGHRVYQLEGNYVIWLLLDTRGQLFEVDVGPKSYYSSEFPNAPHTTEADRLSKAEYEGALRRISQLKGIGALRKGHESAVPSDFGPLNTDQFEGAFVDRVVSVDGEEEIKKFSL